MKVTWRNDENKTGKEHLNAAHLVAALQRIARHLVLGEVFFFFLFFIFFSVFFCFLFLISFFELDTTSNSSATHCKTFHRTNFFFSGTLFHETKVFLSRKKRFFHVLTEHTFTEHTFWHCFVIGATQCQTPHPSFLNHFYMYSTIFLSCSLKYFYFYFHEIVLLQATHSD